MGLYFLENPLWAYITATCVRALRCLTLGRNGLTTAHGLACVRSGIGDESHIAAAQCHVNWVILAIREEEKGPAHSYMGL